MTHTENYNLAVLYPELIKSWHTAKNRQLDPSKLSPHSNKKVWWICLKGHEWNTQVCNRTLGKTNCPFCSHNRLTVENSLAIKSPSLLEEWDYTKNKQAPESYAAMSHFKVWWKCSKNHGWEDTISHRSGGRSCPYCSGKRVSHENNLEVLFPSISLEFHPIKNGSLKPIDFLAYSNKKVWWQCNKNPRHEWITSVGNRTNIGSNCPSCAWMDTKLEQYIEDQTNLIKYNKCPLINSSIQYKPDFQLSDNIYLNVDGLYWHSELNKEPGYHFVLRHAFELENKRIFQFYEDEVYNKWSIINSILQNSLNRINDKVSARKCQLIELSPNLVLQNFYNTNHLMGFYSVAKHYGLVFNDVLVSTMSIRQKGSALEISRFCTKINTNVRGGFQRLLSYVIQLYKPNRIISYCDLRYATGVSYQKAGFKLVGITQGWCWTDKVSRYNRLVCKATPELTEKENAKQLGWIKIYDAGQAKYVLDLLE